jgi:glycine betaine/proline transport system permease protein
MEFISEFPELGRGDLRDFKKAVDFGFAAFSRAYGEGIENFFDPLLQFMIWFERLLINSPWPIILAVIAGLAWLGSRSWKLVLGSVICL